MRTDQRKLLALVERTLEREGCEQPSIRWSFRFGRSSSGMTYHDRSRGIAVTIGTDHRDAEMVVLHELAHWLTPEDRGHGRAFHETAFRLYRTEGMGWARIHTFECDSYRGTKAAHQLHLELTRVAAKRSAS